MAYVEPGKLYLPRREDPRLADEPVVERTVDLVLEGAERMRHALDGIGHRLLEIVHRVDAPGVACTVMWLALDAVHRWIAHHEVGVRHVYLRSERLGSISEFTGAHPAEKIQVLFNRSVAPGTVPARRRAGDVVLVGYVRAAVLAHLLCGQVVHVRDAFLYQIHGEFVHFLVVIRREENAIAAIEAEPERIALDRLDVGHVFLGGIGIVEAQVAGSSEILGDEVVYAECLGVADMHPSIGLGRQPGPHVGVASALEILRNGFPDEIQSGPAVRRGSRYRARVFVLAHDGLLVPRFRGAARRVCPVAKAPVNDRFSRRLSAPLSPCPHGPLPWRCPARRCSGTKAGSPWSRLQPRGAAREGRPV